LNQLLACPITPSRKTRLLAQDLRSAALFEGIGNAVLTAASECDSHFPQSGKDGE
jgi:hypothetical protein